MLKLNGYETYFRMADGELSLDQPCAEVWRQNTHFDYTLNKCVCDDDYIMSSVGCVRVISSPPEAICIGSGGKWENGICKMTTINEPVPVQTSSLLSLLTPKNILIIAIIFLAYKIFKK